MTTVLKTGIVLILVAMGLWIYEHEFENALPISADLDVWCAVLGAALIVIFLLVYFYAMAFGMTSKWRRAGRCVRCGKKIGKNEMYCEFHKQEVAEQFLRHGSEDQS
ncbi:MAG TPA: hypothetical protein PLV45_08720 [bacterium]|nr:hypothetical protein [bacterium]